MRIDFGVIGFLEFLAYLIIAGFLLRSLAAWQHDSPIGKALAYIY